jgi:biotin operon repressor
LFGVPLAFKKNADTISIPQLMDGITKKDGEKLDHGTGLSRDAVVRAIKSLEEQNIIIRERRTDEHNADRPSTFRLNIIRGGSENKTLSGRKIVLSPVRLSDPQETVKPRNS